MEALQLEEELLPVGTTPVHIAVNSGQIGDLRNLLDGGRSLVDQPDQFGHYPLDKALQNGRLEAASVLIQYGANLNTPYGTDPQQTLAQVLISHPAFVSLLHSVLASNTALDLNLSSLIPPLAYDGSVDMLEAVLSRPNVNVDYRDHLKCTGLHYACSRGFLKVVRLLLANEANRLLKTSVGASGLHLACSAGHLQVVAAILEENLGSVSQKDLLASKNRSGDTPIMCAFRHQHRQVVQYILSSHLEQLDLEEMLPNGHRLPGFCFYHRYWNSPSLIKSRYLYSTLPCLSVEESQWALHESVHTDNPEGVGEALEYGASIECLDYMLQTPLMLAAKLGSVDMCKCLVENGAHLNVVDLSGKTALVCAYEHGKHEVVEYLLSQPTCRCLDPLSLISPIATAGMLAVLVSYLEGRKASESASSSGDWLAWLALAVPTAPIGLFQALVNAVAPTDWVQQMCSNIGASVSNTAEPKGTHRVAKHPSSLLPAYVQEDIVGDSHKPRPKLVRSFSRPREWYFARAPPSTTKEWKFKTIPQPKKPPPSPGKDRVMVYKYTISPPNKSILPLGGDRCILGRARVSWQEPSSVVHSAALHNLDVFKFILASCDDTELQEKVLLLRDEAGRTALELALWQFPVISDACSSLGLRETGGLDEYLTREFPLPESLLFEEALLHYVCVGKHVLSSQNDKVYESPLQAWPLWYLQLQVNAFCLNTESGFLQLSDLEDRKKLLDLILVNQYFPTGWSGDERDYPPPLFAAVQHSSSWAIEPLLSHGADPATHHRGRFAIEVAAKHGQVETVQKLLESGLDSFLALSDRRQLFSSLSSSLECLVRCGLIEGAVNLLHGLSLGQYLWSSSHAPAFLFAAQARFEGSEVYKIILRNFINFLGSEMSDLGSESIAKSILMSNMKLVRQRAFFAKASSDTRNLLTLLNHRPLKQTLGELFRSFCGDGNNCMVRFILEGSSSEIAARIINKPDLVRCTPLFYAACGGHVDTVRLLLHHGACLTSVPSQRGALQGSAELLPGHVANSISYPPIVGALVYLALAPQNIDGDVLGKRYESVYDERGDILSNYRDLVPRRTFPMLTKDPKRARELVTLLLPPPNESILEYSFDFPTVNHRVLTALTLISAVRDVSVVEPLLERVLKELPASCGSQLRLGEALLLAPEADGSNASQLFESFLVRFVRDALPLTDADIFKSARKGYWGVIETAVSSNKLELNNIDEQLPLTDADILKSARKGYRAVVETAVSSNKTCLLTELFCGLLKVAHSDEEFIKTCLLTVKFGKNELFCGLLKVAHSKELRLSRWWSRLAVAAVRSNTPEAVSGLLSVGCDITCLLRAAVRLGSHKALSLIVESSSVAQVAENFSEMVRLAAKCNQSNMVQYLFDLYRNHAEIVIESQCTRDVAFWVLVLGGSVSHGHQSLALQATAHISEGEMKSVATQHDHFGSILYYGCYWGLTDLLSCLPYSESDLLKRDGERESPLEAAVANGRLGRIPSPPARFLIWDDIQSWFKEGPLGALSSCESPFFPLLITGFFHQMLSAKPSTAVQQYRSVDEWQENLILRPNAFQSFETFTGNFCAPLLVYAVRSGSPELDILYGAALKEDSTVLEQILRVLFNSGHMTECFEHSRVGDAHSVARYGQTSSLDLLLRCGKVFVNRLTGVNDKSQNVLHSAVLSQGYNVDKLDLLSDQLGDSAPAMSLALDEQGHSPVSLAFSLGKYERADRLLKQAVKSNSFNAEENPAVKQLVKVAHKANGWFRAMIESGKGSSEGDPKRFSIRGAPRGGAISLFKKAAYEGNDGAVKALLVASAGLVTTDKFALVRGLLNKAALNFLATSPSYIPFHILEHPDKLSQLLGRRDFSEAVVFLIQLVDEGKLHVTLDLHRLFLAGCVLPRRPIVKHLLYRTPPLPTQLLQKGAEDAFTFGALEIAAEILLSTDSTLSADLVSGLSPVVRQIFLAPRDYQTTVEDFFESVAHPGKTGRRLPFSEQWLAHEWRPYQRQLVERATQALPDRAPPNPWMIGINWRDTPHTIEVTIDWESFAECLLQPPLPVQQESTPMLVEAVVFSSSVLGQLYPAEDGSHSTYNLSDFFELHEPPEHVVISSVKWPSPPFSEARTLCLSFRAQDRAFVFPPVVQRTERGGIGDESYSTDSGMHSMTDTSVDTKEDEANTSIFGGDGLQDLLKFHKRRLRREHKMSYDVQVEVGRIDPAFFLSAFELCSEVVELSSSPTVAYASFHRSARAWRLPAPPPRRLFGHIGINVDLTTEGEPSLVVVTLADVLDFSIALASDNSSSGTSGHGTATSSRNSPGSVCIKFPPHEVLLQKTVESTLTREVKLLGGKLGRFLRTVFVPRLKQIVRSGLESDSVRLLLEDSGGHATELGLASASHFLQLKSNKLIRIFLLSFCDMLRAYSHKPRVFSDIGTRLQEGLSIIISDIWETSIIVSSPGLTLTVHTSDLHRPKSQRALVNLADSLLLSLSQGCVPGSHDLNVKTLLGGVPCPLLTHVDLRASINFLYPLVGSAARLSVQVMGYGGNRLALPLKYNCNLHVSISYPSGKALSASSSDDPSCQGRVSADLFVATSDDGQFEVVWRPTEEGLHTVLITLNGVEIRECFKRVYVEQKRGCSGKGVVSAGEHLVFVADHVGCVCPFTSRNSRVILIRDTVIEPSPLLKDFPGFQTFTGPSTTPHPSSPSSSTSPSLRPSEQLKRAVSSMTGLHNGGPEPPQPLLHHLGITAAYGGSRAWSHIPTSHVTIHTASQETKTCQRAQGRKQGTRRNLSKSVRIKRKSRRKSESRKTSCGSEYDVTCMSLGCGMYRVSLQCTKAGTQKVLVSCPLCQSVMRIHWLEGVSFYPQPFYVVPGPFSPTNSTVTDANSGQKVNSSIVYKPGPHSFYIDCRDSYGNPHTIPGAIKSAVIVGAGPLDVEPLVHSLAAVTASRRLDSECQVSYVGQGRYRLVCTDLCAPYSELVAILLCHLVFLHATSVPNRYMFTFTPEVLSTCNLKVSINGVFIGDPPKTFTAVLQRESLEERLACFREEVARSLQHSLFLVNPMIRVNRSEILESALVHRVALRQRLIAVSFEGESGIDAGGMSREFFQLLSQELVNPQYALFHSSNGLHRPSSHSSVNPSHLSYFTFCGEVLARMLCDNYQTCVRFTPAVYKFLLGGEECTLSDLKAEDPTLLEGLMEVARCQSEESLGQLVTNFTTSFSRFGSLETVELERGGRTRRVTLRNRDIFIHKFCHWHLVGCIKRQLSSMLEGLQSTLPPQAREVVRRFTWHELELLLCGQPVVRVAFIRSRTFYDGYSDSSREIVWLWQVMEQLSQEELSWFLQFTTGSGCLPVADSGQWKLKICRGSHDESPLPTAATCFNSLTLPRYTSLATLQQKLKQAISFGHLHFCNH